MERLEIKGIHDAVEAHMEQLPTWTALPNHNIRQVDPFLLINHHGPTVYGTNNKGLPFGPHPHRGFETLTFVVSGELQHRDSTGHTSNITAGGVQWMTAGSGIVHAEESSAHFLQHGGELEVIQLWFNLPPDKKMVPPSYYGLQESDIEHIAIQNGKINLISGSIMNSHGPIKSLTNHTTSSIELGAGGALDLSVPAGNNVLFYVANGRVIVNGASVIKHQLVEFASLGGCINVAAESNAHILFCHGTPIGAPVVSFGPFVMNTNDEIHQAMRDYQQGRMGTL